MSPALNASAAEAQIGQKPETTIAIATYMAITDPRPRVSRQPESRITGLLTGSIPAIQGFAPRLGIKPAAIANWWSTQPRKGSITLPKPLFHANFLVLDRY